jgi:F5/8 type C domain
MQIKTKLSGASFFSILVTLGIAGNASATGFIFSPVNGVINNGGPGYGSLADTYNQNGLSTKFVSGVTDFDDYLALNPTHTTIYPGYEWFSDLYPQRVTVTYDLGSIKSIDRLALWNEESAGIGRLDLSYSTDNINFLSLASGLSPLDTLDNYPAQVFSFTKTDARYVRFEASACPQHNTRSNYFAGCGIGEVAFSINANTTSVPEPFTIVGTLVGGTAAMRMRKKLKVTKK